LIFLSKRILQIFKVFLFLQSYPWIKNFLVISVAKCTQNL
jgi:hypothetical protein